jgi:hypothetical protein
LICQPTSEPAHATACQTAIGDQTW